VSDSLLNPISVYVAPSGAITVTDTDRPLAAKEHFLQCDTAYLESIGLKPKTVILLKEGLYLIGSDYRLSSIC